MRTMRWAIVAAWLSAAGIAGCGDEEARPVDLKGTADTAKFKGMMEQQTKGLKADKAGRPLNR